MATLPLLPQVLLVAVIAGVLINSTIRFSLDQKNPGRRLAAVASSVVLLLLLSIYYARFIGSTFLRLAVWRNSGQPLEQGTTNASLLQQVGEWFETAYFPWWIDHLPSLFAAPVPDYAESVWPLVILSLAYLVRAGIFVVLRPRYEKRHAFVSAYWMHITLWFVVAAFLRSVYDYNALGMASFIGLSALAMIGGLSSLLGDLAAFAGRVIQLGGGLLSVSWKVITILAGTIADGLRWLRREFGAAYRKYVRTPVKRIGDFVQHWIERANAAADSKLDADEEQEEDDIGVGPSMAA